MLRICRFGSKRPGRCAIFYQRQPVQRVPFTRQIMVSPLIFAQLNGLMHDIQMMNIRTKDLNLLPIFLTVAEELNLTRASDRLGLSQPALSHALGRLRQQFGDPLFVRGQRGLVATPKVAALLPKMRAVLDMAAGLYGSDAPLDLASLERKVVIASTAYFEARAIAPLIKRTQHAAPGLQSKRGRLPAAFPRRNSVRRNLMLPSSLFRGVAEWLSSSNDFQRPVRLRVFGGKPVLRTRMTIDDYLDARHLQIEPPPGVFAPADHYLQSRQKIRNIVLRVGNFLTPAHILSETDYLLTCPMSLAAGTRKPIRLPLPSFPSS